MSQCCQPSALRTSCGLVWPLFGDEREPYRNGWRCGRPVEVGGSAGGRNPRFTKLLAELDRLPTYGRSERWT